MKKNIIILLLILVGSKSAFAQKSLVTTGRIISVSDIHFDPFYDSTLVVTLVKTPYKFWPSVFAESKIQTPNSYNADSNYPLVKSALDAMKKQNPSPEFIIITGDFLSHSFQKYFAHYAKDYPDSLPSFTNKTIKLIASMFDRHFPKTVILPVLGNNDSYCGDYNISPISTFLNMFAKTWVPLQCNHSAAADKAFIDQFTGHGYYTYTLHNGGTMIMLNDIYMSSSYVDKCGNPLLHPAADELTWLTGVLKQAEAKKEKVWIAYHIPPGVNVYSTIKGNPPCPQTVAMMMKDSSNKVLVGLMDTYHNTIKASFAGHTHMDDFRVLYDAKNKPISFIHITPAVSPLFGNNPGFQTIEYDKATFELKNWQTCYYPFNLPAKQWTLEYDFKTTYGVTAINPVTLNIVREKINTNPRLRNRYINSYTVGHLMPPPSIDQSNWKAYWCGTGTFFTATFEACNCAAPAK